MTADLEAPFGDPEPPRLERWPRGRLLRVARGSLVDLECLLALRRAQDQGTLDDFLAVALADGDRKWLRLQCRYVDETVELADAYAAGAIRG